MMNNNRQLNLSLSRICIKMDEHSRGLFISHAVVCLSISGYQFTGRDRNVEFLLHITVVNRARGSLFRRSNRRCLLLTDLFDHKNCD